MLMGGRLSLFRPVLRGKKSSRSRSYTARSETVISDPTASGTILVWEILVDPVVIWKKVSIFIFFFIVRDFFLLFTCNLSAVTLADGIQNWSSFVLHGKQTSDSQQLQFLVLLLQYVKLDLWNTKEVMKRVER